MGERTEPKHEIIEVGYVDETGSIKGFVFDAAKSDAPGVELNEKFELVKMGGYTREELLRIIADHQQNTK